MCSARSSPASRPPTACAWVLREPIDIPGLTYIKGLNESAIIVVWEWKRPVGCYASHLKLWMANAKRHFIMGARFIDGVYQGWEISSWKAVEVKQAESKQVELILWGIHGPVLVNKTQ